MIRAREILSALLTAAVVAGGTGCRAFGYYVDYPENPVEGMRRIAVAPVLGPAEVDPFDAGDILAAELVQCPNVEHVVRPIDFQRVVEARSLPVTSENAIRALARDLDVDGVLVAEITEFDPYHPPRIGVVAQLFITGSRASRTDDVIGISRRGRAGPVETTASPGLVQVERVYDAARRDVFDRAKWYAFGHDYDREALSGGDRILWIRDLYLRFVSFSLVKDIFREYVSRMASRESEQVKGGRER